MDFERASRLIQQYLLALRADNPLEVLYDGTELRPCGWVFLLSPVPGTTAAQTDFDHLLLHLTCAVVPHDRNEVHVLNSASCIEDYEMGLATYHTWRPNPSSAC